MPDVYHAPVISPNEILGQYEPLVVLTFTVIDGVTQKIRWTLRIDPLDDAWVSADVWTVSGWTEIWKLQPETTLLGATSGQRAALATAAFQELQPFVNSILQP